MHPDALSRNVLRHEGTIALPFAWYALANRVVRKERTRPKRRAGVPWRSYSMAKQLGVCEGDSSCRNGAHRARRRHWSWIWEADLDIESPGSVLSSPFARRTNRRIDIAIRAPGWFERVANSGGSARALFTHDHRDLAFCFGSIPANVEEHGNVRTIAGIRSTFTFRHSDARSITKKETMSRAVSH